MEWILFVVAGLVLALEGVRLARIRRICEECNDTVASLRKMHRQDLERAEGQRQELVKELYDQTERLAAQAEDIKVLQEALEQRRQAQEKLLESVRKARVILER